MALRKFTTKKILVLWICLIAIALTAGIVYALSGSWNTGFKVSIGETGIIDLSSHSDASCRECKKVTNAAGQVIFVPTKSCAEWNAFKANLPAGVTISNCFVCGDPFVDTRNGKSYPTVSIGGKCWMAKNLNYGTYMDGFKAGGIYHQDNDSLVEKYCWNNDSNKCDTYGGYYQWHEAVQLPKNCDNIDCSGSISYPRQGICPNGWHIPSDVENTADPYANNDWYAAENALSPGTCTPDRSDVLFDCGDAGTKMKAAAGLNVKIVGSLMDNGNGWIDNIYEGGIPSKDAHFWSSGSTPNSVDVNRTWGRDFEDGEAGIKRKVKEKNRGLPVRCVKN